MHLGKEDFYTPDSFCYCFGCSVSTATAAATAGAIAVAGMENHQWADLFILLCLGF
jgi:hypothetical protein